MNLDIFAKLVGCAVFFAAAQTFGPNQPDILLYYFKPLAFMVALCVVFAPPSRLLAALLVAVIVADFFLLLPNAPNHRHVLFFLGLLLGMSLWDESKFESLTLPAIRLSTIFIYFFAFFAKLNTDYINYETSCSIEFYNNIKAVFPFYPDVSLVGNSIIWSSLLIEGLLVALLILRPAWGIILGVAFHSFLALDFYKYFVNFSTVMFVCLAAFLPAGSLVQAVENRQKLIKKFVPIFFIVSVTVVLIGLYVKHFNWFFVFQIVIMRHLLWFIALFLFCVLLKDALKTKKSDYNFSLNLGFPQFIVIVLVLLNGLSPYLGIKTRTSFNMYSNMEIGHQSSNHFIVPRSLDVFGYLEKIDRGVQPDDWFATNVASFRPARIPKGEKCIW